MSSASPPIADCKSFADFLRIMSAAEFAAAYDDLCHQTMDRDPEATLNVFELLSQFCEINFSRFKSDNRLVASVFYRNHEHDACSFRVEGDRFPTVVARIAAELRKRQIKAAADL